MVSAVLICASVLQCTPGPVPGCPADLTSDCQVGVPDLLQVISQWGDGCGIGELMQVIGQWGACPPGCLPPLYVNSSYRFNAAELDYMEKPSCELTGYPYTMACWVKPASFSNWQTPMFFGDSTSNTKFAAIRVWAGGGVGFVRNDEIETSSISLLQTDVWSSIVVVMHSAGSGTLYVGSDGGTPITGKRPFAASNRVSIGRRGTSTPTYYFDGQVAEVALSNQAWTAAQVADYRNGRSPEVWPTQPVFYRRLRGDTTSPAIGAVISNNGATLSASHPVMIYYDPLHYSNCPFVQIADLAAATDLLVQNHPQAKRIGVCGDSTLTPFGGAGSAHVAWREWLWHQFRGHTPGTMLAPPLTYVGGAGNGGGLMQKGIESGGKTTGNPYATTDLPPGFSGLIAGYSFQPNGINIGGRGRWPQLNHNNDNETTVHGTPAETTSYPLEAGHHYVGESINQGTVSRRSGTMHGGGSLIDAAAGLRLEVAALTNTGSVPSVRWIMRSLERLHSQPVAGEAVAQGTLFGSLYAAPGNCMVAQTPVLPTLNGSNRFYQIQLAGDVESPIAGAEVAWILGERWVSQNQDGLMWDSLCQGGATSSRLLDNHADCGFILAALGHDAYWINYGTNDAGLGVTLAQYDTNIRALIAFLRDINPDAGVILEAPPPRTGQLAVNGQVVGDFYAGVLHQIAQDTPNVIFVNTRRRAITDGFTTAGHTSDGVHYNLAGSELVARASVTDLFDALNPDAASDGSDRK